MKKKLTRLTVLLASAGLTLLGFNGCGTAKKAAREEARIRDSIEQARLRQEEEMMREAMRQDSRRRACEDSMRIVRMGQTKVVYGGPSMMGRRVLKDSTDVEPGK